MYSEYRYAAVVLILRRDASDREGRSSAKPKGWYSEKGQDTRQTSVDNSGKGRELGKGKEDPSSY